MSHGIIFADSLRCTISGTPGVFNIEILYKHGHLVDTWTRHCAGDWVDSTGAEAYTFHEAN